MLLASELGDMGTIAQLLGRTLVIVAHPDDEAIGCGGLLQRMRDPIVLFCTDGAPADPWFWQKYGSREEYARLRRREAESALAQVGVKRIYFLAPDLNPNNEFTDQDLFLNIGPAMARIDALIAAYHPDALLAPAYEGGHPDHDTCAFLAWCCSREHVLPAWEFPLYYRRHDGTMGRQCFIKPEGGETLFDGTQEEVVRKRRMLEAYASQQETIAQFNPAIERFRPQPVYDFAKPPHAGRLNYEAWGWPVTGTQLIQAFDACVRCSKHRDREPDPKDPGTVVRGMV